MGGAEDEGDGVVFLRGSTLMCVCCRVWRCVAVCCRVLQCVAVCCSVLPCVAVCCRVLQCVAVRDNQIIRRLRRKDAGMFLILLILRLKNLVVQVNSVCYFQKLFWYILIVCCLPSDWVRWLRIHSSILL